MLFGFKLKWILHDLNKTVIVFANHNDDYFFSCLIATMSVVHC